MTDTRQRVIALRLGLVSALVAGVCTTALIVDHLAALGRAEAEKNLVEALREQVATDHAVATPLHEERERQTGVSMARESRGRAFAWILLAAGSVGMACGRWYMSLRVQPLPRLDDLVSERFAPGTQLGSGPRPTAAEGITNATDVGIDLAVVDALVERFGRDREAAIPVLQAIQAHFRYLPDEALQHVCQVTEITPAQIAGASSFYAQFRRSPVGRHVVRVCHGTACHVAGAERITQELRRHLDIAPDQDTDPRRLFTLDAVACLGCCSLAPVMVIEEETAGKLTPASARQALDALVVETPPT